jgi:hypothetical protein
MSEPFTPSITKRAAQKAIAGTGCTFSVAREIAEDIAEAADADGVEYDVDMLADVVRDRLVVEGWL